MTARKAFQPHESDAWKQLSDQLGGEHIDKEGWRQDRVRVRVDEWTVTIDLHSEPGYKAETIYTRFRAPYVNTDGLHFEIYPETLFADIAKLFGMQDIQTGFPEFDKQFIIKANDPEKVKALCACSRLRGLIKDEPDVYLHVRNSGDWFADEFPDGVDELCLEVDGQVNDAERLKRLYELFAAALHTLCEVGSAYEE